MHVNIHPFRELEMELSRKNMELERFLYSASHDLKSPLFTIRGFLDRIVRLVEAGELDKVPGYAARIEGAADRMGAKIEGILELAQVGGERVSHEVLEVRPIIDQLLAEEAHHEALLGAEVEVDVPLPTVTLGMDRGRSVLENLLSNAIRYGLRGDAPKLRIGVEAREGWAEIVVEDNGPGVPEAHRKKIFELFERLTAGKRRSQPRARLRRARQ